MQTPRTHRISASTLLFFCLGFVTTPTLAQNIPGSVPIVIQSNNYVGPVEWAQDRAGAPAVNGTINLQSATGAGTAASSVNARGANLQVNGNTVAQPSAMVMQAQAVCTAATMNWSAVTSCSGDIPQRLAGQTAVATDSTAPGTGSATYTCGANGTWSAPASVTCTSTCTATTGSWTVGAVTCSAALAARTSGQTFLATDSGAPSTGSANFNCSAAGTWSLVPGFNCASQPPLGTLAGDLFVWSVNVRENGETNGNSQVGYATQAEINSGSAWVGNYINDPVNYEYGAPYPILHSPGGFRVGVYWGSSLNTVGNYGAWHNPSWFGYVAYYASECTPATRTLKTQFWTPVSVSGIMCRKGYTP